MNMSKGNSYRQFFWEIKNDGSHRLILNLKGLKKYLEYKPFKMQTFKSVLSLIQAYCFMTTIDLKDAYYLVKIGELDTKYLKFLLNSRLLKFVVLPNGLSPGSRKFTKLTKPPLALLRIQAHTVAIYIDDIISVDYLWNLFCYCYKDNHIVSESRICTTPCEKQIYTIQKSWISWLCYWFRENG